MASWGRLGVSCGCRGGVSGRLGVKKGPKMGSSWPPKRAQNGIKIRAKIDRSFDASRGRFLDENWPIFGPKMGPSWDQNGIPKRC